MNPLTKVKLINELNAREAKLGVKESVSWHQDYKDSAWIFMGGFPYELTEGDIICVFSQYGEIVNINLVRDKVTGRSRGFCFLCYEDQRSTVLAVDNLNGIKLKGRTIRVDHVANYRPPKDGEEVDEVTQALREKGCGARTPSPSSSEGEAEELQRPKKEKKKKRKKESKNHSSERSGGKVINPIKQERDDPGYEKYNTKQLSSRDNRNASPTETGSRSGLPHSDKHRAHHSASDRHTEQRHKLLENKHRDNGSKRPKEYEKREHEKIRK
ncbi:RNA-binding motif protein, X-linked 2 [Bufo bufo]|uniref:RNA-binding motif protein, X-linked 2 n=1 Tax=Bufo bufo TaxID=8384 RepID=UPI001ABD9D8B|nr:RNA-binding motif protein, X-linked 2 [Bufo bufo]XP_040298633.1 RNA-binding motif protein, X-linked 2 [Bufo bufo]